MAEEGVERIEAFLQNPLDVVHGVEHPGVALDQAPADHSDGARLADPRLVVAVHVGAHGQLGFLLGGAEQLADVLRVPQRIAGALRGSRDGAGFDAPSLDANEHLRRGAHQLLVAELQQQLVRAGAGVLDPLEQLGRAAAVRRAESLTQHDFVIIAAAHALAHDLDVGHVLFRPVIRNDGPRRALDWRRDLRG